MSMRLQARLSEKRSSHIEASYLRNSELMILEDVPAEMVFEASQGFIEHESQKHDYLPYFHLIGKIKEVRGSFPFNVTSLYFAANDESFLIKDVIYYPSPEELGHIISTGRYYSRHFQVPEILSANTYTLPCRVSLSIIPPANQAQYEANQYMHFMDLDDEDKTNLPIFYLGITGSGVTRKNDRLLDYYGIDVAAMSEQFVFTAESSGYTDPPLMKYMEEPMVSQEVQFEDQHFLENAGEGLLHDEAERQREDLEQVAEHVQEEFRAATPEDALIAQTDRAIELRMSERFDGQRMSLAAVREHDRRIQADEDRARPVREEPKAARYDGPREAEELASARKPDVSAPAQPKPVQVEPAKQPEEKKFASAPDAGYHNSERDRLRAKVEQLRGRSRLQPTGQPVAQEGFADKSVEAQAVKADGQDLRGKDVSDASVQAKVDEERTADVARNDAISKMAQGRDVTPPMEEVTQKANDAKKPEAAGKTAEEDEFL